ncbi:MAG: RimK/LysX family protein [Pyrinomonadaceae bacterium]
MNGLFDQRIIGRRENAVFPALHIGPVPVKIDTGAYSSAIHCSLIEVGEDGLLRVVFLEGEDPGFSGAVSKFKRFETRKVRSSNGHTEVRYAVRTGITFGSETFRIRLTLADRSSMRIPVLIGRRFLKRHRFVVDPAIKYQLGMPDEI